MATADIELLERMQQSGPTRAINVKADRAAVRARRIAETMVAEESGPGAVRPGYNLARWAAEGTGGR